MPMSRTVDTNVSRTIATEKTPSSEGVSSLAITMDDNATVVKLAYRSKNEKKSDLRVDKVFMAQLRQRRWRNLLAVTTLPKPQTVQAATPAAPQLP